MSNDGDSIQTEWNQSKATHKRLDKLFTLLHENALGENYDACLKVLYRVLAEASSVLTDEEYQNCKSKIEACTGWENKINNADVYESFLEAERKLRNNMQEHGLMIAEKEDMGIPGGNS